MLGASDIEIDQVVGSPDRIQAFRQLYQGKLRKYAKFVRDFEMRDHRNKVIYYLFFASNHHLGHAKMKDAFWKIDRQSGFKFSDHTDPNQPVLFELDPAEKLVIELKKRFAGTTQMAEKVIMFVENETAYTSSHARKALKKLEACDQITVEATKADGKKRRKDSFKAVVIHF